MNVVIENNNTVIEEAMELVANVIGCDTSDLQFIGKAKSGAARIICELNDIEYHVSGNTVFC